ncbi:hypothetical protein HZS_3099 [Henneguya salminicola]|nr:hypothetical protein HZS_3099 [Henneguya salminicola]
MNTSRYLRTIIRLAINKRLIPFNRTLRNLNTLNETYDLNPEINSPEEKIDQNIQLIQEKNEVIKNLETEIKILQNHRAEAFQEVSRVRSRINKEVNEAKNFGCAGFATDLLEVADGLDHAINIVSENTISESRSKREDKCAQEFNNLYQGIVMTRNMLFTSFQKNGVEKIIPHKNDGFPPKTIGEIFRIGYHLRGRIIRPAEVGVK